MKNHFISLNFLNLPNGRIEPNDLEVLFGLNEATYCGWLSPIMHWWRGRTGGNPREREFITTVVWGYKTLASLEKQERTRKGANCAVLTIT